ncbi:Pentatricopeptide repeat-containing protein [Vigna angularis]|uniref:Pentatricopeptide repeat-containing protein n=1 Tax=Phaseolus angularis TaxID=3914 RepID=A0A8T0LI81_PHAAN|nr:Pentatricopeptide repeat-containing protein [Vigna angularis]
MKLGRLLFGPHPKLLSLDRSHSRLRRPRTPLPSPSPLLLRKRRITPLSFTFVALFSACFRCHSRHRFGSAASRPDTLDWWVRCARKVFDEMPERDVVFWVDCCLREEGLYEGGR